MGVSSRDRVWWRGVVACGRGLLCGGAEAGCWMALGPVGVRGLRRRPPHWVRSHSAARSRCRALWSGSGACRAWLMGLECRGALPGGWAVGGVVAGWLAFCLRPLECLLRWLCVGRRPRRAARIFATCSVAGSLVLFLFGCYFSAWFGGRVSSARGSSSGARVPCMWHWVCRFALDFLCARVFLVWLAGGAYP